MFKFLLIFAAIAIYNVLAADRCDTDVHPTHKVKGSCMEKSACTSKGGTFEDNWCMSHPESVKCCFISADKEEAVNYNAPCVWAGQFLPHQDATKYYHCGVGLDKNLKSCPAGQVWVQQHNWCDFSSTSTGGTGINYNEPCVWAGQMMPHPDPSMFYHCGVGLDKNAKSCPTGQVWVQEKGWCDFGSGGSSISSWLGSLFDFDGIDFFDDDFSFDWDLIWPQDKDSLLTYQVEDIDFGYDFDPKNEFWCDFSTINYHDNCVWAGQFMPHPDPTKFYHCGVGLDKNLKSCPAGQVWVQEKSWCDGASTGVAQSGDRCDTETHPQHGKGTCVEKSTCSGVYVDNWCQSKADSIKCCFKSQEQQVTQTADRCDTESHPQYGKGTCAEKSTCTGVYVDNWCESKAASIKCCFNNQEWSKICSAGGNVHAHQDPTKYYRCVAGRAVEMSCPAGQVYISDKNYCDTPVTKPTTIATTIATTQATTVKPPATITKQGDRVHAPFLRHVEGFIPYAYCVKPVSEHPNSGVTIGVGVDLANNQAKELRAAGVSESIISKLTPYFDRTLVGQRACDAVARNKVVLSLQEAGEISDKMKKAKTDLAVSNYNRAKTSSAKPFDELTCAQKTVIMSVMYQYETPSRVPKFWAAVTSNNWNQAISELRNFGDAYAPRRYKEADLLQYGNNQVACPGPSSEICEVTRGACTSNCAGTSASNMCLGHSSSVKCCMASAGGSTATSAPSVTSSTGGSSSGGGGSTSASEINNMKKDYGETIGQFVKTRCGTGNLKGIANQLAQAMHRVRPMTNLNTDKRIRLLENSAAIPWLQTSAYNYLKKALDARPGSTMTITSALRTLPQQFALYEYKYTYGGRCAQYNEVGFPGRSHHEIGIAVDLSDWSSWKSALQNVGCTWNIPSGTDEVHFVCATTAERSMSVSVEAFQKLWNCNNPDHRIAEDGAFGPATRAALLKSPVNGFPKTCL